MKWINSKFLKVLNQSKSSKKQKEFGFLMSFVSLVILSVSFYKNGFVFNLTQQYIIVSFVIILVFTFIARQLFFPFLTLWLIIGELLGAITSTLIIGVVYFLVFSPISLLIKSFSKEKTYKSEWKSVKRDIDYTKLS